jgi:D-hexose-6-phosphate mutarotase
MLLYKKLRKLVTIITQLVNSFKYLEVKNSHAQAKIALQGAHIFHYQF